MESFPDELVGPGVTGLPPMLGISPPMMTTPALPTGSATCMILLESSTGIFESGMSFQRMKLEKSPLKTD